MITGINYVGLNKDLWSKPYTVKAHFASSGGIFSNAEVTYRGVTIGRVGTLHLTKDGVIVDLKIDKGEKVPARHPRPGRGAVGGRGAVRRPAAQHRLRAVPEERSAISLANTSVPVDENTVLVDLEQPGEVGAAETRSPRRSTELGKAFDSAGPSLQSLHHRGNEVIKAFQGNLAQTISLIEDAKTVSEDPDRRLRRVPVVRDNIAAVSETLRSSDAGHPAAARQRRPVREPAQRPAQGQPGQPRAAAGEPGDRRARSRWPACPASTSC